MSTNNRRRKLFVEPRMQGLLVFKILLYWINAFLTIGLLLAAWNVFTEGPGSSRQLFINVWNSVGPALFASLVLLPIIVLDSIRWSNRYAGPMVRLHESLRNLADGKDVQPLNFRKGDLWFEMAEQFNRISARMKEGETSPSSHAAVEISTQSPAPEPAETTAV